MSKFSLTKFLRMAANPRKPQTLKPTKIKVHTVVEYSVFCGIDVSTMYPSACPPSSQYEQGVGIRLSWQMRLSIALDTARGLLYLHTAIPGQPLVHRDVKRSVCLFVCLFVSISTHHMPCPEYNAAYAAVCVQCQYTFGSCLSSQSRGFWSCTVSWWHRVQSPCHWQPVVPGQGGVTHSQHRWDIRIHPQGVLAWHYNTKDGCLCLWSGELLIVLSTSEGFSISEISQWYLHSFPRLYLSW